MPAHVVQLPDTLGVCKAMSQENVPEPSDGLVHNPVAEGGAVPSVTSIFVPLP